MRDLHLHSFQKQIKQEVNYFFDYSGIFVPSWWCLSPNLRLHSFQLRKVFTDVPGYSGISILSWWCPVLSLHHRSIRRRIACDLGHRWCQLQLILSMRFQFGQILQMLDVFHCKRILELILGNLENLL